MPKFTLTFNQPDEQEEFNNAINGGKYRAIIEELDDFLRSKLKYDSTLSIEQHDVYNTIRNQLTNLRKELNVL